MLVLEVPSGTFQQLETSPVTLLETHARDVESFVKTILLSYQSLQYKQLRLVQRLVISTFRAIFTLILSIVMWLCLCLTTHGSGHLRHACASACPGALMALFIQW
jgi:hypothetical protein